MPGWIELIVRAEKHDHDRILTEGFRPLLEGAAWRRRGYFLRDDGRGSTCLRLRLEGGPELVPEASETLVRLLQGRRVHEAIGAIDTETEPVPLAVEGLLEGP